MKVLGFNGSPRKNGNTQTVIEAVLKGAASKGAETRLVNLNELNVKGCQGCDACKKKIGVCVQKDDLSPLLQEMKSADAIVLGTPIYWYHVSSQFKALVDRCYCFYGEDIDPATGEKSLQVWFPHGKKIVVVTSQEAPEVFEPIHTWLNLVAAALNAGSIEFIEHCSSENKRDSARKDGGLLEKAEGMGRELVS
ncbi:MAG: flavodoxin family protein [Candidatus Abyssobacteria bacterium SURF_5]|uniref:Flavodoxin family protein n=1 Tax=Abyssobacteria bacterium (strain SURF_5) TaxID=2093360 RepID=A0A3A4NTT7_ABYX5|nr:MAG: flavodoxin family protein [Candidatus Abyssubacteria bacterium SURF_5]